MMLLQISVPAPNTMPFFFLSGLNTKPLLPVYYKGLL